MIYMNKFFIKKPLVLQITCLIMPSVFLPVAWAEEVVSNTEFNHAQIMQCASVVDNAGRLACFDALTAGENPSVLEQKRPLHLSSTLKSAMTRNPQAVRADEVLEMRTEDVVVDATTADDEVLREMGVSQDSLQRYTPLSLAYDLDRNSERGLWSARPHNINYVLPMHFHAKPNRSPDTPSQDTQEYTPNDFRALELKFQLSLKAKAAENLFGTDADLWVGYTQQSHWQVYNEDNSRPFREHNYEPEIFVTQPVVADLPFGGRLRMVGAGVVHHSNGQEDPLSRSWNRAYLMAGAEWGKLTVVPRVWARVLKESTGSTKVDDNPDITDYYGYGDVKFLYQLDRGRNVSGTVRLNPATGKGAMQLDYVHPLGRGASGYVQIFHGYGESLIDYNHENTTIGVGVMLNEWLGL